MRLSSLQRAKPPAGASSRLYRVTLTQAGDCRAGRRSVRFVWRVANATTGAPVKALQPWLGHDMHVAVARADLGYFEHSHGDAVGAAGSGGGAQAGSHAEHGGSGGGAAGGSAAGGSGGGAQAGSPAGHGGGSGGDGQLDSLGVMVGCVGHPALCMHKHRRLRQALVTAQHRRLQQHDGHGGGGGGGGGSSSASTTSSSRRFGPDIAATISFPSAGSYLLVGQMRVGGELVLAPFAVSCS